MFRVQAARRYLLMRPPRIGCRMNVRTFDLLCGVLGSWWAVLVAAVGSLCVVVAGLLVQKQSNGVCCVDRARGGCG